MTVYFLVLLGVLGGEPRSEVHIMPSQEACMAARAEVLKAAGKLATDKMVVAGCVPVATGPMT